VFVDDTHNPVVNIDDVGNALVARIVGSPAEARDAWYAVAAQGANQHTQTYEWYDAYGRTLGASSTDWVIVILLRGNQPVGILPLCRQRRTVFRIPLRTLSLPYDPNLLLGDVAMPVALRAADIDSAVRSALACAGISWDVILLRETPADSQAAANLASHLTTVENKSSWFSCRDGYQAICANFSTRLRKSLKKAQKNPRGASGIEIVLAVNGPAIDAAFADFLRVEMSGWKAECGSAIALAEERRSFYELLVHSQNPAWRAEINLLQLRKQTIAAQFCIRAGRTLTLLKIGYDQAHRELSPGNLLLNQLLKTSCEAGELDAINLVTDMDWMKEWGPRHIDLLNLMRFNHTPAALAARALGRVRQARCLIRAALGQKRNPT
jgi:CelD/BcsL family acetyltransferase involved in cellulose biosynthesis